MATATGNDLLPTRSHELLQRADAELVAAQFSSEAWERFSHAHLAALRGGAALLAVRGRPGGRRPPRTVWDMLRVVSPELARWSDYFAAGAGLRSAIEAGRFDAVSEARAEQALCAAEDFVDELRTLLAADASTTSPGYGAANRPLGLRAS
ncbi:MAG TPA: SAV_6107 family HEPN domain-containing protein [Cellulomonas sp.]